MHPEAQAARRDLGDLLIERLVVGPDRAPAVDDEEDVAEPVARNRAGCQHPAVGRHRVDAMLGEDLLAVVEQRADLGDRAPQPVGLETRGDRADVRQVGQAGQRPAAEVEAVELHLLGRVRQRQGRDQRAHDGALAALRPARHQEVRCREV